MPEFPPLPESDFRAWFRRQLVPWFQRRARDLPWRRRRDPYAVWVSEIMLQQTLVATVVSYFDRFLNEFPTIEALARADEQQVLKHWEGLGYYRRARNLHRAAQIVLEQRNGLLPDDPEFLKSLPGLGRYTVNAILSQAFERRLPILEANSLRVLCRVFGIADDSASSSVQKFLWKAAEVLLPKTGIGDFNQALMELGALVCSPRDPDCTECPLHSRCYAFERGLQAAIPAKKKPLPPEKVRELCLVLRHGDRVLFVQRPADADRWANLWEFPRVALTPRESLKSAAARLVQVLGLQPGKFDRLTTVRHDVTRFRITLTAWQAQVLEDRVAASFPDKHRWSTLAELAMLPTSTPQRKAIAALRRDVSAEATSDR